MTSRSLLLCTLSASLFLAACAAHPPADNAKAGPARPVP
jgi:outer membrane biogenesis lipoprotein LolB